MFPILEHKLPGGDLLTFGVQGKIAVHYQERTKEFQDALQWYRQHVNPNGDAVDLCGYIASASLEFGPTIDGIGRVMILNAKAPAPSPAPWCMVVLPVVNIEHPDHNDNPQTPVRS